MKQIVKKLKSQRLIIEVVKYKELKTKSIKEQNYEKAAYYRDMEKSTLQEIQEIEKDIIRLELGFNYIKQK